MHTHTNTRKCTHAHMHLHAKVLFGTNAPLMAAHLTALIALGMHTYPCTTPARAYKHTRKRTHAHRYPPHYQSGSFFFKPPSYLPYKEIVTHNKNYLKIVYEKRECNGVVFQKKEICSHEKNAKITCSKFYLRFSIFPEHPACT